MAKIHALDETERRAKPRTDVFISEERAPVTARAIELERNRGPGARHPLQIARVTEGRLSRRHPGVTQLVSAVERHHVAVAAAEISGRGEDPDRGLVPQIALQAQDGDARPVAARRMVRRHRAARCAIVDREPRHRPLADLAGHARAYLRIRDPSREKQVDWRLKVGRVLDEERPLLREEHLEPLVDRHLRFIGFDLAEIRVQRQVDGECILHDDLAVDACPSGGVSDESRLGVIQEPGARERAVRDEQHVAARRNLPQTRRGRELLPETRNPSRDVRPERRLIVPSDHTRNRDTPLVLAGVGEPQALERDRHPHHEAKGVNRPSDSQTVS